MPFHTQEERTFHRNGDDDSKSIPQRKEWMRMKTKEEGRVMMMSVKKGSGIESSLKRFDCMLFSLTAAGDHLQAFADAVALVSSDADSMARTLPPDQKVLPAVPRMSSHIALHFPIH